MVPGVLWTVVEVYKRDDEERVRWKQSLLLGGLRFGRHGRCESKSRRCLYYVRSIEDLLPNSFTMVVVNALTAQTRPSRSTTFSLWSANR